MRMFLILFHIFEHVLLLSAIYEYNKDGDYFIRVEGRWWADVIATYNNQRSVTECLMKCTQHKLCQNINYNEGLKQCELNKGELVHSKIELLPGWNIYYLSHQTEADMKGNYCDQINCGDNLIEVKKMITICEHTPAQKISCPYDYQVICITNAFYGRQSAHVCRSNTSITSCASASSTDAKVKKLCDGSRECILHASPSVFGDPCEGIRKYLEVRYVCSGYRPVCQQQATVHGNGHGACCVFPFIFNGTNYNECVKGDTDEFWCATTRNYDEDKLWGNCVMHPRLRERSEYKVKVQTGDDFGSGTDANVFLTVLGDWGKSPELSLKNSVTNDNPFEKGHIDMFSFNMSSLGNISSIEVWHDDSGFAAGWLLSFIEVTDINEKVTYSFPCNCWLNSIEKRNLTTSN